MDSNGDSPSPISLIALKSKKLPVSSTLSTDNYAVSKVPHLNVQSTNIGSTLAAKDNRESPTNSNKLLNTPLQNNSYSSYFTNIVNKVNTNKGSLPNKPSPDWTLNRELPRELSLDLDTIIRQEIPRTEDDMKTKSGVNSSKDLDWSSNSKFHPQGQHGKKLPALFPTPITSLPYLSSRPQTGNNTPVSASSLYISQHLGSNDTGTPTYASFNLASNSPINSGTPLNITPNMNLGYTNMLSSNNKILKNNNTNQLVGSDITAQHTDSPSTNFNNVGANNSNIIHNVNSSHGSGNDIPIPSFGTQFNNQVFGSTSFNNSGSDVIKPLLLDSAIPGYNNTTNFQSQTPINGTRNNNITNRKNHVSYTNQLGQNYIHTYSNTLLGNTDNSFINGSSNITGNSLTPILPMVNSATPIPAIVNPPNGSINNTKNSVGNYSTQSTTRTVNIMDPLPNTAKLTTTEGMPISPNQYNLPLIQQLYMDTKLMGTISKKHKRGYYKCTHCPETFASIFDYARHMDNYNIKREYKCPFELCPWKILGLPRRSDLRRHCAIQHKEDLPEELKKELNLNDEMYPKLDCPYEFCDKTFIRKDSYNRHVSIVHKKKNSRFNKRLAQILESCPEFEHENDRNKYIISKVKNFRRRSSKS